MKKPYGTHGSTETDFDDPKFQAACEKEHGRIADSLAKSANIDNSAAAKAARAIIEIKAFGRRIGRIAEENKKLKEKLRREK